MVICFWTPGFKATGFPKLQGEKKKKEKRKKRENTHTRQNNLGLARTWTRIVWKSRFVVFRCQQQTVICFWTSGFKATGFRNSQRKRPWNQAKASTMPERGVVHLVSAGIVPESAAKPRLRQATRDETAAWIIRHLKAICFSFRLSPGLTQQTVRPLTAEG